MGYVVARSNMMMFFDGSNWLGSNTRERIAASFLQNAGSSQVTLSQNFVESLHKSVNPYLLLPSISIQPEVLTSLCAYRIGFSGDACTELTLLVTVLPGSLTPSEAIQAIVEFLAVLER